MRTNKIPFGSFLLVVVLSSCAQNQDLNPGGTLDSSLGVDGHVIYGSDGRKDLYEVTDPLQKQNAQSVVSLFEAPDIIDQGERVSLRTSPYGSSYNLCPAEKFREQASGAFCSGALVGPDLVLTAGHCVTDALSCQNTRLVFGFNLPAAGQQRLEVTRNDLYKCKSIVSRILTDAGADYAVIKLDRPVVGRRPLRINRRPAIKNGDAVTVMGHPAGLPLKITLGGKVRSSANPDFFVAAVDTYGGNSGSPVFGASGLIEGVLVRGENDFVRQGSCNVSQRCTETTCRGEDITRVSKAAAFIPEVR